MLSTKSILKTDEGTKICEWSCKSNYQVYKKKDMRVINVSGGTDALKPEAVFS